jgi:hypothetical protein
MKIPYKSQNPNAGVVNYEIADGAMILEFTGGKFRYVYDRTSPGALHLEAMMRLAIQGNGLTTYVNQHVRKNYAGRLPPQPLTTAL